MANTLDLSGKTALVTGASSGLGARFARVLAENGARVVLASRRLGRLKELRAEIEAQGWSLNPGRYIGTAATDDDEEDFIEKLEGLYEEFTRLSDEADELRANVDAGITGILSE